MLSVIWWLAWNGHPCNFCQVTRSHCRTYWRSKQFSTTFVVWFCVMEVKLSLRRGDLLLLPKLLPSPAFPSHTHRLVFPPFSSLLFSYFVQILFTILISSWLCFYCRVLSFYLNSWENSKSSFHKHFRHIAQV